MGRACAVFISDEKSARTRHPRAGKPGAQHLRAARWLLLAGAALLPSCCATGARGWDVPDGAAAEALAGARAAVALEERFGGIVPDAAAEGRMARVLARLHAGTPTLPATAQCRLLAASTADAASLPGPRLYVTRGLAALLDDDALVAAVLAHELAHLAARDHFKPRCGGLDEALQREELADTLGSQYLVAAGYPPAAMQTVVRLVGSGQPADWPAARCAALTAPGVAHTDNPTSPHAALCATDALPRLR